MCTKYELHQVRALITALFTLSLLVFIAGCTSTEVHTFRNDDLVGKYYDRILLVVDIPNANDRFVIETLFQNEFQSRGLDLIPATNIVPNLYKMEEHELLHLIEKEDIHSVLTMTPAPALDLLADKGDDDRYRAKNLQWVNDLLYFNNPNPEYPEEELYSGIYGRFSFKLIDLQTGKVAWLGITLTERDGLPDFEALITDNVKETIQALSNEKLIVPVIAAD